MSRPNINDISSGTAFARWYWLKAELVEICKLRGLPTSGRKAELTKRIADSIDRKDAVPDTTARKPTSRFNWARETLTPTTVITDSVSFGPNFRRFMTGQIGKPFVCHGDFMAWVRAHPGKTLADAIAQWHALERRKQDPSFRREIASGNMYNQYVRDFTDAHPGSSIAEARTCWLKKKLLPTEDGVVRYAVGDLGL